MKERITTPGDPPKPSTPPPKDSAETIVATQDHRKMAKMAKEAGVNLPPELIAQAERE